MKLRVSDVTVIKQQLRICGCNLFAEVKARGITTGEELPKDINENLLNADSISNKKHLSFVTERLVKGRKGLFELIAKLLIALGIKSKKNCSKLISVIMEGRHLLLFLVTRLI